MASSFFWNRIAKRYARQPIGDEAAYQKKLQITREYLQPQMKMLEFGCGTGSTAIAHAPFVKHILATDFSAKMIEIAQAKADAQNVENITFQRISMDDLKISDQSMDAVMGHSILHLLDNWRDAIVKAHGILKPGGVFVTSTACIEDTMPYFRFIVPFMRLLGLTPQIFTIKQLEEAFANAGFEIEHQWQPPGKGTSVFIVARKAE